MKELKCSVGVPVTKDNWIKAFRENVNYDEAELGCNWGMEELESFIYQVEKDAKSESYTNGFREGFDAGVEKTNKRWREKVEYLKNRKDRFNTEQMRRQEFGYNKALSDLLEEKK